MLIPDSAFMIQFFFGLLQLMRPLEWSKSFGNMVIAAVTAGFVLGAELDPITFLTGFAALALLWSGLYALNDYTDRKADALHAVKKKRAIPSGLVPAKIALIFSIALILVSFLIAIYLNGSCLFMLCMFVIRFYAGWVLFVPAFNAPIFMLLFVLGIQFGGFGLYRMASKEHEKKLGLRSSVVLFGEKRLIFLSHIALVVGSISYLIATLTILPISYLFLGLAMLLPAPLYKTALKRPQEIEMGKMYWIIYLHYLAFLAGFLLLYCFHVS